jgi:large subunit ribosomal protein L35Ae
MKGLIANYRRSRHVTSGNQVVIHVEGVNSKAEAQKLVGKKVTWNTGKRSLKGEVTGSHGNSGAVRARFETGMPGQAVSQEVTIN